MAVAAWPLRLLLLEYLSLLCSESADGSLPWNRLRTALASADPASQRRTGFLLADLLALGHADQSPDRARWGICRSALAGLPDKPVAVLTGARSRALMERLQLEVARRGLGPDAVEIRPDGDMLERVTVTGSSEQQLAEIAAALRIGWVPDAARRIAVCLPSIAVLLAAAPQSTIEDEPYLERLDDQPAALAAARWRWQPVERPAAPGVYRRIDPGRVTYWLRREHETRRCERAVAIYGCGLATMEFDDERLTVLCPYDAAPPDLHRRVLTLCSGQLPRRVGAQLAFGDVPEDTAHRVLSSLRLAGEKVG